jgi:predicted Zn finger-like uncharacterized protein
MPALLCPACSARLRVPGAKLRRKIRCPRCRALFRVADAGDVTRPAAARSGRSLTAAVVAGGMVAGAVIAFAVASVVLPRGG